MPAPGEIRVGIVQSLFEPVTRLIDSRQIVYYLTRKRIVLRYRGSLLGVFWALVSPALTLAIYTVVFGVLLRARWSTGETNTTEYALLLYLGLCVYWFVSDCVSEAPNLVLNHPNYVKKVIFPLEVLPYVSVADALFHTVIRLAVFVVAVSILRGLPPWTIVLLPLVWIPVCLWTLALCWILAAAGVFLRDLREVIALALIAMLFLSPVFYSLDQMPSVAIAVIRLNPIVIPVTQLRDVAYFGVVPDPIAWLQVVAISAIFARVAYAVFSRSRGTFADVV